MKSPHQQDQDSFAQKEGSGFGNHPFGKSGSQPGNPHESRSPIPFELTTDGLSSSELTAGDTKNTLCCAPGHAMSSMSQKEAPANGPAPMAPIQAKGLDGPVQRNGGDNSFQIPIQVRFRGSISREEFKKIAFQQIFGGPVPDVDWTLTKELFSETDNPVTLWVSSALYEEHKGKINSRKGFDTDETGAIEGSEERQSSFESQGDSPKKTDLLTEVDRRFQSAMKGNPKGDLSAEEEKALRRQIQDEVLFQEEYIGNLPENVLRFFRVKASGMELGPENLDQLFRIAKFIEGFSPNEANDYLAKVAGDAANLDEFETALQDYKANLETQREVSKERVQSQIPLLGMESIYEKYRTYRTLIRSSISINPGFNNPIGLNKATDLKDEISKDLENAGAGDFNSFEKNIEQFERSFELESQNIALSYMERYRGGLFQEQESFSNSKVLNQLLTLIKGGASKKDLAKQYKVFQEEGLPEDKQIDLEVLRSVKDVDELGNLMQHYSAIRITDLSEAIGLIGEDSRLIYKLEGLMPHFYLLQGMQPGSIYDMAVQDKMRDDMIEKLTMGIGEAYAAIAVGVMSFGTSLPGYLAAGGAAASFGMSGYMAFEEYANYTVENDISDVGLAQDPSIVWLIVSVVGAGIDLGFAVKTVRALAPAAKTLDAGGDIADFQKAVQLMEEAGKIESRMAKAITKAAEARQKVQIGAKELNSMLMRASLNPFLDPYIYMHIVEIGINVIKQGTANFEVFMEQLKAAKLVRKAKNLTPDELKFIDEAWADAKVLQGFSDPASAVDPKTFETIKNHLTRRVNHEGDQFELLHSDAQIMEIIEHGKKQGLSLKDIEDMLFISCRSNPRKRISAKELKKQMEVTNTARKQGFPNRFKDLDDFNEFKEELAKMVSNIRLDKAKIKWDELRIQGSSMRKMNPGDIDLAIVLGREQFEKVIRNRYNGKILKNGKEVKMLGKGGGDRDLNKLLYEMRDEGPDSFTGWADSFKADFGKKLIHGKSSGGYFPDIKRLINDLKKDYPHLNIDNITIQMDRGRFDMHPDFVVKSFQK